MDFMFNSRVKKDAYDSSVMSRSRSLRNGRNRNHIGTMWKVQSFMCHNPKSFSVSYVEHPSTKLILTSSEEFVKEKLESGRLSG